MDQTSAGAPTYPRHVADHAEKRETATHTPSHVENGVNGERVAHARYDELVRHKLQAESGEGCGVGNMVTAGELKQGIEDLMAAEPVFAALVPDPDERQRLLHVFATLPLAQPLACKLTAMRDERPEVMRHSLKVAYCAAALAGRCGLPQHAGVDAAAAGVFHDLGLLHVDPDLLRGMRPLQEHERNYLYAHPLASYLILEHSPVWHPVVSTAVLEHHERIDGSGYPQGLHGNKLGQLGQLLAVAELAAALLSYGGGAASRNRLEVVLRMNEGKLNHEYASRLLEMFPTSFGSGIPPSPMGKSLEALVDLSVVFMHWQAAAKRLPQAPLAVFVEHRVAHLAHSLARIGIDLEYWSTFNTDAEFDAKSLAEMEAAAHECVWQLHAIADEARRRWDHLLVGSEPIAAAVGVWLARVDALRRE
ncbi:MAG: HD domain-containing protein [Rhodocyclales bacterium]|nr:HD domain-containing protein [Rhodocyclales bacterium]